MPVLVSLNVLWIVVESRIARDSITNTFRLRCANRTSTMFTKEWVGTANATVGGWGNLGGGVTQVLMGSILFPLFRNIYNDPEKAWRTICVFPAVIGLITAFCAVKFTDDSLRKGTTRNSRSRITWVMSMSARLTRWASSTLTHGLLFVQYACCFGVEITMNNAAALYFKEQFGLTTEKAAAIASIFGWMNLFARGLGGYVSDRCNRRWGEYILKRGLCLFCILRMKAADAILSFVANQE